MRSIIRSDRELVTAMSRWQCQLYKPQVYGQICFKSGSTCLSRIACGTGPLRWVPYSYLRNRSSPVEHKDRAVWVSQILVVQYPRKVQQVSSIFRSYLVLFTGSVALYNQTCVCSALSIPIRAFANISSSLHRFQQYPTMWVRQDLAHGRIAHCNGS